VSIPSKLVCSRRVPTGEFTGFDVGYSSSEPLEGGVKRVFDEPESEKEAFPAVDGGRWRPAMLFGARVTATGTQRDASVAVVACYLSSFRPNFSIRGDISPFFGRCGGHRLSADDLIGGPVGLGNQGHVGATNRVKRRSARTTKYELYETVER
jgi:hypothetical protein